MTIMQKSGGNKVLEVPRGKLIIVLKCYKAKADSVMSRVDNVNSMPLPWSLCQIGKAVQVPSTIQPSDLGRKRDNLLMISHGDLPD